MTAASDLPMSPSRDEFVSLAATYGVVPVWCEVLADLETPLSVYARLRGQGPTFLLESAEHGRRWGRHSFIGTDPFLILEGRDGQVQWHGSPPDAARDATGPLAALDAAVRALRAPEFPALPLHGGAVGMVGYDAVREIEDIPASGRDDLGLPDVRMVFPRHVVGLDHLRQTMVVVTNVVVAEDPAAQYDTAVVQTRAMVDRLTRARVPAAPMPPPVPHGAQPAHGHDDSVTSNMTPEGYRGMVERVKEYVRAGDTFQTVVSQRFAVATDADALDIYRVLRVINPSPYLFLFDFEDCQIVGSSPEALVQVQGRRCETWPIAGTRPRGATPHQDRDLERELVADAKERAEHVMLVDLGRNDLGRVCEIGSVEVDEMMEIHRYSHVMHMASAVTGTLRDGLGPVDVLRAIFPAGTVSGAPKVRAMQIIDELEPTRRGCYAGAIGYVDFSGNLDACIAIRTLVLKDGTAYVQAGAGIVADSDPATEEAETHGKAGAVLDAVRAAGRWPR